MNNYSLVSVDPGSGGGIVISTPSSLTTAFKMPDTEQKLLDILVSVKEHPLHNGSYPTPYLAIEQIPKYCGKNIPQSAVATLYGNYKFILGAALALNFITFQFTPQAWQKYHNLKRPKGTATAPWKRILRDYATKLHPELKPTLYTSDAILIHYMAIHNELIHLPSTEDTTSNPISPCGSAMHSYADALNLACKNKNIL